MNVVSATREGNELKVVLTVDSEKFEEGIRKAYLKNRKYIAVPGFRKGKAPRHLIENLYGAQVFYEDGVNEIFPDIYKEAILDQGWKAVGQPSVTAMNINDDKTVDMTVETSLYPEVTLGQYKGLEVPKAEAAVTDEELDAELDKKAKEVARIMTVERPVENGDTAVIDFEGFDNGVPFDGGKGENHELVIGSNSFVPGFEEQLIGMSAGEEKDIDITFPKDYHADLAGKAVVFHVLVHEVKKTVLPEKDDEFAKDVSEFDTLEELRSDIRAKLLKEKEDGINKAFENAVVEQAVKNMTAELPACMVDEQVEKEMERFDYQLRQQGASLDAYAKMMGGDLSGFKTSIRPNAELQLRTDILLDAVVDAEKIEVSEEELEKEFAALAEAYQMELEKLKKAVKPEDIKGDLAVRKAARLIIDSAVPTAAPEAAEKPEPAKKPRKPRAKKTETAPAEEAAKPEE